MEKVLEIQKKAFLEEGPPSLEKRKDLLRRCASLIETHEKKIIKALNHDFQNRSIEEIKISSPLILNLHLLTLTTKLITKYQLGHELSLILDLIIYTRPVL